MNKIQLFRATTLCAALALTANSSHAQPAAAVAAAIETVEIKLISAPASLVAYWLDPMHLPAPRPIQQSRLNRLPQMQELDELPRQAGNGNGPRDLKLPAGIESLVAIDPQNVLRIQGTAAGVEELKKLLVELDVPINQIEIEAIFSQMSPEVLKTLPLKFVTSKGAPVAPSLALVPPTVNFTMELNRRIADNKVRIITAPRVTAIDGLTAQLTSTESLGLVLSTLTEKPTDLSEAEKQWLPGFSALQIETGLNCTPILRGDLIKLFTRATLNNRSANVNTTLRDGETIAIAMPAEKSDTANRTVIFLSVRLVRRAGDETARAPEAGATKLGMIR